MRRCIPVLLCAAALLLFSRSAAAEPTGQQLQGYFGLPGSWGMDAPDDRDWRFQIGGGYRFSDRRIKELDETFTTHEFGINATLDYKRFWVYGEYFRSISSEDLGNLETDTDSWGFSGGYRFGINKNLDISPVIGYSRTNTEIENFDIGFGGLNIGVNAKWTPGFRSSKPFPRWTVFLGFLYYPDLDVFGDLDDSNVGGDDGIVGSIGVEYNFTRNIFAGAGYQYADYSADFGVGFRDHRFQINGGYRF